ncbi:hypothetical protein [Natrinema salaciae]|uniref:PQQ-like domain-containing protein n=1 Tax=Natrinema salaciae TaxID=1186196 RepID=A0A1H9GMX8_9EURY|nr:hypothetical protein [Natrinema salaciae]SEQ51455.1 hypothetical protein SAMN04489841_1938 [Natrinema salaciae]
MRRDVTVRWWQRLGAERERVVTDAASTGHGGLYVVGRYEAGARRGDGTGGFLTRIDATGAVSWEYSWSDQRRPTAVTATPAGPVAAGVTVGSDTDRSDEETPAWLASFTASGDRRWERDYPNGVGDGFETVVAIPGGVVAGGHTGEYTRRTPDSWERVYGTRDWVLAADLDDGTERWRESYYGNDCLSLVAGRTGTLRFVGGSRVVWIAGDGTVERSRYYYAETGSSDTLESIAPSHRDGDSVVAGKAWEGSTANQARILVIDTRGEILLDRSLGLPNRSNFGQDAVALDDGYVLSGTTLFDGCSLPWLVRFDGDGGLRDFRFVVRPPGATPEPELTHPNDDGSGVPTSPDGHPVAGRYADADVLVPVLDGLFVVYNEHDRSKLPEHRQTWIGYLS